jgi:DNA primase catalytic subunit
MLDLGACLRYYKRLDIQKALVEAARDREISVRYLDGGFGKRPDILINASDVLENVKLKASSFHCSEEVWSNPLQISTEMRKDDLTRLRKGWDLVLDIDSPYWEISKLTTWLFIEALKAHGIRSISLKFSGNKGFHIGVPFKAFPEKVPGKDILTKSYFPDGPRRIASYLLDYIERHLIKIESNEFVNFGNKARYSFAQLKEITGKDIDELTYRVINKNGREVRTKEKVKNQIIKYHYPCASCGHDEVLDVFVDYLKCKKCDALVRPMNTEQQRESSYRKFNASSLVAVDTVLIAPRHLYRMVYSLHEKTGLASIPIEIDHALDFNKDEAVADSVTVSNIIFLDDSKTKQGEAEHLLKESFDFSPLLETEDEERKLKRAFTVTEEITQKIPEELFPPCIQLLLKGVKDGRKRALFMLINFLTTVGWTHEEIKERLDVWNKANDEQLRETLIVTHLNYHKQQHKNVLPPNCPTRQNNVPVIQQNYYTDLQVCHPDSLCARIKNPVQYAKKKAWLINQQVPQKKGRKKKDDEKKV